VLSLCSLLAFILLPCFTLFLARRRMSKMRVLEQAAALLSSDDGAGSNYVPPPEEAELHAAPAAEPGQLSVPLLDTTVEDNAV
jgi:hypothetical protein